MLVKKYARGPTGLYGDRPVFVGTDRSLWHVKVSFGLTIPVIVWGRPVKGPNRTAVSSVYTSYGFQHSWLWIWHPTLCMTTMPPLPLLGTIRLTLAIGRTRCLIVAHFVTAGKFRCPPNLRSKRVRCERTAEAGEGRSGLTSGLSVMA